MTPELEQELRSVFDRHHAELLERGRKEVVEDENRQHERGDEWVIGGHVCFTAELDGYKLMLSYTGTPDEELALLGGAQAAQVQFA